ncbi:MAG: hypothetical protein WB764_17385, partial [Xanthobacteraceae bacterium]
MEDETDPYGQDDDELEESWDTPRAGSRRRDACVTPICRDRPDDLGPGPSQKAAGGCHFEHYLAVFFERYVAAPARSPPTWRSSSVFPSDNHAVRFGALGPTAGD